MGGYPATRYGAHVVNMARAALFLVISSIFWGTYSTADHAHIETLELVTVVSCLHLPVYLISWEKCWFVINKHSSAFTSIEFTAVANLKLGTANSHKIMFKPTLLWMSELAIQLLKPPHHESTWGTQKPGAYHLTTTPLFFISEWFPSTLALNHPLDPRSTVTWNQRYFVFICPPAPLVYSVLISIAWGRGIGENGGIEAKADFKWLCPDRNLPGPLIVARFDPHTSHSAWSALVLNHDICLQS